MDKELINMKIYMHIGTEKTGTTTLQNFFNLNRVKLREQNTLYPISPGVENHAKLSVYSMDHERNDELKKIFNIFKKGDLLKFRSKFEKDFMSEVKRFNPKKIILSNEHCSTRLLHDDEIYRLKELLGYVSRDVKIVVYLRRQDDYYISTYSTWIKCGGTNKIRMPNDYDSAYIQNRYNYKVLLDRWAKFFGMDNLIVRVFEKEQMVGNSLLDDFLHVTGIEFNNFTVPSDLNASLSPDVLEFLRIFNKFIPFFNENGINPGRGDLTTVLENISTKNKIKFSGVEQFYCHFEEENKEVAKKYLKRQDGILFKTDYKANKEQFAAPLCIERAIEITSIIWKHLQSKIKSSRN
jgi:hypothetical protein